MKYLSQAVLALALASPLTAQASQSTPELLCNLWQSERYGPSETSAGQSAIDCAVSQIEGIKPKQVNVISINDELGEIIILVKFSSSTVTYTLLDIQTVKGIWL